MRKKVAKKGIIIIPARGGSKGIKNKNIVNIHGKPLIYFTIILGKKAKENKLVEEAIVSTDSPKIAEISKKIGISVPFLRPKKISGDKAKSIDLIIHALDFFKNKGINYDYVVLLQPTSPARNYNDIKNSLDLFLKQGEDSLISVCLEERNYDVRCYYKKNGLGIPLSYNHNKGVRRQDLEKLYIRNAGVYITSTDYLRKTRQIISDNPLLYEMPVKRSIDIDRKSDLTEFRKLMRKRKP